MLSGSSRSFWCLVLAVLVVGQFPAAVAQTPGSLDNSFGGIGAVITAVGTGAGDDRARALLLQPDGKIVVAGTCDATFCMVRYLADGTLDTTFGAGGRVNQPRVSTTATAYAAALQPDGKIVMAGNCIVGLSATMCVARFLADGALDSSFGTSAGWTLPDVTNGGDIAKAIALQSDGKIVLAGVCTGFVSPTLADFCLVRLNADGTLDQTFNSTGKLIASFGGGAVDQGASAVAIQPDGKIVAAGYCATGTYDQICVARFLGNGTALDGNFGSGGSVSLQAKAGMDNRAYSLSLLHNGKVLLGGECGTTPCAVRLLPDGALDPTFGNAGVVGVGGNALVGGVGAVALNFDGGLVLAGWSNPGAGIDFRSVEALTAEGTSVYMRSYATRQYISGAPQGWNAAAI